MIGMTVRRTSGMAERRSSDAAMRLSLLQTWLYCPPSLFPSQSSFLWIAKIVSQQFQASYCQAILLDRVSQEFQQKSMTESHGSSHWAIFFTVHG